MEHPSVLIESMREFQNELDAKNQIALQQLNKDIDLLNSLEPGKLPEFDNKINYPLQNLNNESIPAAFNTPSLDLDLSSRLTEIKEFNASFVPLASEQKRRENIEALMSFATNNNTGVDKNRDNKDLAPNDRKLEQQALNGVSSTSLDALHQATIEMESRDREFKKSMQEFTSRLEGLNTPVDQPSSSQIPKSLGNEILDRNFISAQNPLSNHDLLLNPKEVPLLPRPEIPDKPYNPSNWKDNAEADNIMDFKQILSKLSLLSPESNKNALGGATIEKIPLKSDRSQELLPKFTSVLSAPDLSIPDFEKKYLAPSTNSQPKFNSSIPVLPPSSLPAKSEYVLPSFQQLEAGRMHDTAFPPRGNSISATTSEPIYESQESSKAIVNALRILQDRVGKLESEKSQAKLKIHDLERELDSTKKLLRQYPSSNHEDVSPTRQVYSQSPNVSPTKSNHEKSSGTLDSTMKNILDARLKVDMLKERVDHVRHLAEGSQFNHSTAFPTNLSGEFGDGRKYDFKKESEKAAGSSDFGTGGKYDFKRDAKMVLDSVAPPAFDQFLQSRSDKSSKDESRFQTSFQKPVAKAKLPRSISPGRFTQNETKQLKEDILKDRDIRVGSSSDSAYIKDKVIEKLQSSKQRQKQNQLAEAVPSWQKPHERARSASKSSSNIRKRTPADIPGEKLLIEKEGREMPFVIGKNVGKSFSVTANLQKVFSLLKSHTPEARPVTAKKISAPGRPTDHRPKAKVENRQRQASAPTFKPKPTSKPASPSTLKRQDFEEPSTESLTHILGILEQEYRDAKTQYNHLVKQYETVAESMTSKAISENTGSATLKAIGNDLRHVIQNIEAKSDQIAIIRDILTSSLDHKKSSRKGFFKGSTQKRYTMDTANTRSRSQEIGKNRDLEWKRSRARSQSPGRAMASLSLLKSSLKVQNALTT